MNLTDTVEIGGVRRTRDGYLVADARVARTGIQVYAGREVGRPDLNQVRVWRPEDEVFDADAMASVAWRPVTVDHPAGPVGASNWKELAVGFTGDGVARDGAFIRVPLTVMDAAAIETVAAGKRQLSLGYSCDLQFADGVTPDGQAYDAIQKNIRVNHLAICSAARGGPDLKIGDREERPSHQPDGGPAMPTLKTILVDGLSVEVTDQAELAINKLKGLLADALAAITAGETKHAGAVAALETAHTAAIATKDAELGAKDAKIAELEAKVVTGDALDLLVTDRAAVVARAKTIAPDLVTDGKTNAEIRRAAVSAKLGDEKVKDKPEAYVDALFDHLVTDDAGAGGDQVLRNAIKDAQPPADMVAKADAAHAKRKQALTDAWAA